MSKRPIVRPSPSEYEAAIDVLREAAEESRLGDMPEHLDHADALELVADWLQCERDQASEPAQGEEIDAIARGLAFVALADAAQQRGRK